MASYQRLKSGAIRARVFDTTSGKTRRLAKSFPSRIAAEEWAQKVESRNAVLTNDETVMTVKDLHQTHMLRAVSASTIEREQGHYKHLAPKFGKKDPMRIVEADIVAYVCREDAEHRQTG